MINSVRGRRSPLFIFVFVFTFLFSSSQSILCHGEVALLGHNLYNGEGSEAVEQLPI
jgi:hypothetical protein